MTAKKQYYKVINTVDGHHGVFYKLGINVDPNPIPLNEINSCGKGAIYFTDLENLSGFSGRGNSIAWVTPISKVKQDNRNKYKAHKINITKILPFKDALKVLNIKITNWEDFGVLPTKQEVIKSKTISLKEKIEWLSYNDYPIMNLVLANKKNKDLPKITEDISVNWNSRDISKLIKEGLTNLIDDESFSDLAHERNYTLVKKLVDLNPKRFLTLLIDLV